MVLKASWIYPTKLPQVVERELEGYGSIERQILFKRGLSTAEEAGNFLSMKMDTGSNPLLMTDMVQAVERIVAAIEHGERIVVYGDYDVDGVTSVALLVGVIKGFGGRVSHYIPDRFSEGYGLNEAAISAIAGNGVNLLISVDCGIRDADKIEYASQLDLDVIVTDHHQPGGIRPSAVAVVNPRQDGDPYPFKDLAGVGVAFKLVEALARGLGKDVPRGSLELVALGTVADVSKLRGENRSLVSLGLEELNATKRAGLQELMKITKLSPGGITAASIGFIIGPRLNAATCPGSNPF